MPSGPLPAELAEFLAKPNPCVIATLNADGSPNTVATWYLWEDGRVLVNMAESRARLDNIRRDGRVSLTVLDEASWYNHVSLRGPVQPLPGRRLRQPRGAPGQRLDRGPLLARVEGRLALALAFAMCRRR